MQHPHIALYNYIFATWQVFGRFDTMEDSTIGLF